jgi:hypothetical protein
MKEYPSQEFLKDLLKYENGMLFYIKSPPRTKLIGTRVGTNGPKHYRVVTINGEVFLEHRLIYILLNGVIPDNLVIDHIDRDPSNNKIENLRAISQAGNSLNRSTATHVQKWTDSKWYARFKYKGKQYSKFFQSEKEAEEWVVTQKEQLIN